LKIALVELSTKNHHSLIFNWLSAAKINNWEVVLFTTDEIYKATQGSYNEFDYEVVLYSKVTFMNFLRMKNKIRTSGVNQTVFLTMQSHFIEFYLANLFNLNYGITVHNTNAWFNGNSPKKLSHYLKGYIRNKIKKKSNFFVVNSSNMYKSAEATKNVDKPLLIMPFSLKKNNQRDTKENSMDRLTVVYPGMVDIQRKRYDNFARLANENPKDKFILLGKPSSELAVEAIMEEMKKIKNIKLFDSFISIEDFEKYMIEADLLFSDILVDYNISDMSEVYGKTKDSGISYLMAEFELPCLLNDEFENLRELECASVNFTNYDNLINQYMKLKDKEKLIEIEKQLHNSLKNFTMESFSEKLKIIETY